MTPFDEEKQLVLDKLGKPDKSKKGSVDEDAWPMIETINALDDYYTTSSCAGRISVFLDPVSGKKRDAKWLFVTHEEATVEEVSSAITESQETLWLRMEPPIYHVACRDEDAAVELLKVCQRMGWKRSGIISTGGNTPRRQRYMVEIVGNERVDVPVVSGKVYCDEEYVSFLVSVCNEKLQVTREKMELLRKELPTIPSIRTYK